MVGTLVDRVWEAVPDRVGGDLRVVTRYEGTTFDTRMRHDVRARYDATEDRRIVDETVVDQRRVSDVSEQFDAGAFHALVRVFDDAWIVAWPDDPKSGVIVSTQRGGETATPADVEWCIGYLDDEVGTEFD